jgi:hypothetical protein
MRHLSNYQIIEVRGFKWPYRPRNATRAYLLGEDGFGRWLGVVKGDPWWAVDGSRSGVFEESLVKVVPEGTFWTACFKDAEPVVDVDIILPVRWGDNFLDEVDLELDILRAADGSVRVRDQEEFARVRDAWAMPTDISTQAEATCEQVRALVEQGAEPFGAVGTTWLSRFLDETRVARP